MAGGITTGVNVGSTRRRFLGTTIAAAGAAWARSAAGSRMGADAGGQRLGCACRAILARIVPPVFAKRDVRHHAVRRVARRRRVDAPRAIAQAIAACAEPAAGASSCRRAVPHRRDPPAERRQPVARGGATLAFSARPARVSAGRVHALRRHGVDELLAVHLRASSRRTSPSRAAARSTGRRPRALVAVEGRPLGQRRARPSRRPGRRLIDMVDEGVPVAERVFGDGHYLRPNFIQPYRCQNVLIEGVTIVNSPMWEIHPVLCTNVTVRDVTITHPRPEQRRLRSGVVAATC